MLYAATTCRHLAAGALAAQGLAVPLAGRDEQRAEARGEQEPVRQRDPRRDAARHRAQQEAGRHAGQLEHRLVLEAQAVRHLHADVRQQDEHEPGPRAARQQAAPREQQPRRSRAAVDGDTTPLAIGRLRLSGWARSASRSQRSLTR